MAADWQPKHKAMAAREKKTACRGTTVARGWFDKIRATQRLVRGNPSFGGPREGDMGLREGLAAARRCFGELRGGGPEIRLGFR